MSVSNCKIIDSPEINAEEHILLLLLLLPFWTPLNPPLGITCLKSYLKGYGYMVKTVDANVVPEFSSINKVYFEILKKSIPQNVQGNFYNIGNEIFFNHLLIHMKQDNENEYVEAISCLIQKTFFCNVDNLVIIELISIVHKFYNMLLEYTICLIDKEKPSVLGLSVYTGNHPASMFVAKLVREKYPTIKIVMGGGIFAGPLTLNSSNMKYFLAETKDYIDKIFIGEGEKMFLMYLQGKLSEDKTVYTMDDLNNEAIELETLSTPDFTDLKLDYYVQMSSYTSRGCPFKCNFCSETVNWRYYRKKSAKKVVNELIDLFYKHKQQLFLMGDSLLNPIVDEISEEMIKRDISIYWDGYLRVDQNACNIEHTFKWRKGGLYRVRLGIETGSPHVLKLMNKKITVDQIKKAISSLAHAGIKTTTYWIVGYPGETEEDFQQTLNLIEELKDDIWEAECNPFVYYFNGQVSSDLWAEKRVKLYPDNVNRMIGFESWTLDCEPKREVIYNRVNRFVEHCRNMGIPNTYSLQGIYEADERWKSLHHNAVPSLLEFKKSGNYINEKNDVKELHDIEMPEFDENDFDF